MSGSDDTNEILEEIDKASKEIMQLKGALRRHNISNPEGDAKGLEAALEYWGQCKKEAEDKLGRLSRG